MKQQYMRTFDKNGLLWVQEDRQTTKEKRSKEEDRQGADVKTFLLRITLVVVLCWALGPNITLKQN